MSDAPDFSALAPQYAASRLRYPPELFAWLAEVTPRHELAWDAATGNGQAAVGVAEHFQHVIATDISAQQIAHAVQDPRIEYRVATAEASGLEADSIDLVTISAAIHWIDRPRFYDEVRRVTRRAGVLAAWTYHVAPSDPPLVDVLGPFYRDFLAPYFHPGVRLVDERYEGIGLPGEPLKPPSLRVTASWTADQVLAFVRTWSGVQAYVNRHGTDPVLTIEPAVRRALGGGETPVALSWPLYIRAARIHHVSRLRAARG